MKVNWITLRVNNLDISKKFYGEFLGMSLEREFELPGGMKFAFFKAENDMEIEIIENGNSPEKGLSNPGISIGTAVSNYDEILESSRNTGIVTQEPSILGGQLECFFISDPDGMSIQIARLE